ncbi:MAG: hypothetical protein ACE366_23630 [Bradymonadia bacterium]
MKHLSTSAALSAALLLSGCAGEAEEGTSDEAPVEAPAEAKGNHESAGPRIPGKADEARGSWYYTSASRVESLEGDLEGVAPAIDALFVGDPLKASDYLKPMSALGHYGPIGEYGPLGLLGPAAGEAWSPSSYISGSAGWDYFARTINADGGPLSADGPLGSKGPLNTELWPAQAEDFKAENPNADDVPEGDFIAHLAPGGVWGVLGPVGPLGALGPLGPLGPIGGHGYKADDHGQYLAEDGGECWGSDEAGVCRTVDVEWAEGGEVRTYELFEAYTEEFAAQMSDNDTSFMVKGTSETGNPDTFEFTSGDTQFVTVLVVSKYARYTYVEAMQILGAAALTGYGAPTVWTAAGWYHHYNSFNDFDLTLRVEVDGKSHELNSVSGDSVDWIQARVPAGAKLSATVSLYKEWPSNFYRYNVVDEDYYLYVVGSTGNISDTAVSGPHQSALPAAQ